MPSPTNSPVRAPLRPEILDDRVDPNLEALARLMDSFIRLPGGWRVGLDAILGLLPVVGDVLSMFVSLFILQAAAQQGVPRITLLRMGLNVGVDALVGAVPFLGDLFDVGWKANERNVELMRCSLAETPREARQARRGDWLFVGGIALALAAVLAGGLLVSWFLFYSLARVLGVLGAAI